MPNVPQEVWVVGILAIATAINWVGMKVADKTNLILLAVQLLILTAFVVLCVHYMSGETQPFWSASAYLSKDNVFGLATAGAAIACYSFLGFDAITTLSEETINAKHNVPRAILYTTLAGGLIFIVVSFALQMAHPHAQFADPDSAASEIAHNIGGDIFVTLFVIGLVIGQLASAVSAQASGSRLIYSMAKRGALPPVLAKLNCHQVPGVAVMLMAIIGLAALFMSLTTSTSFINFGAFVGFMLVNLSIMKYFWGKGGYLAHLVIPLLGFISILILFLHLDNKAFMVGIGWLVLGAIRYFFIRHRQEALESVGE